MIVYRYLIFLVTDLLETVYRMQLHVVTRTHSSPRSIYYAVTYLDKQNKNDNSAWEIAPRYVN